MTINYFRNVRDALRNFYGVISAGFTFVQTRGEEGMIFWEGSRGQRHDQKENRKYVKLHRCFSCIGMGMKQWKGEELEEGVQEH